MTEKPNVTSVAFDCLGCKLNQAETEQMSRRFAAAGYRVTAPEDGADVFILNTCTVTQIADRKSRRLLRLARRRNSGTRLVVTGCYAERFPGELQEIEGVDYICRNKDKPDILRLLEESGLVSRPIGHGGCTASARRARSFVRVQQGCRNLCAYCVIPLVRGEPQSVPVRQVLSEIKERVSDGYREVVLTGTEIGTYDSDGKSLKDLLERILEETSLPRIRISSLQPQEILPELIGLWRDARLCPHFHLSLQSGSDSVLARMKRRYSTADYSRAVSIIRGLLPGVSITSDIIVGFPGESGDEFRESLDFCRRMKFARIHVFPFSPRPGTAAADMSDRVAAGVINERRRVMLTLAEESLLDFNRDFLEREAMVLWEQKTGEIWSGHTANYIKVYASSDRDLTDLLVPAKLNRTYRDGLWGEVS